MRVRVRKTIRIMAWAGARASAGAGSGSGVTGSFSGRLISPRPERGPEPRKRRSLAILLRETATTFMQPEASTRASCAARASNLFGAVSNGRPVSAAMMAAIATS